jgi:exodeoxyribonuclease-3
MPMKIISFNINSIRARPHQLKSLITLHNPDVIGLQETKVHDDDFPFDMISDIGYLPIIHGQKGHYGVALLSKKEPIKSGKGFEKDSEESQKRLVWATFKENKKEITIINGYFPQGEEREHPTKFPAKKKFYKDLIKHLKKNHTNNENIIVMGDLNISPQDIDIGIGENNRKRWLSSGKCSFLPEEREWLSNLVNWGLNDTYRTLYPKKDDLYSWFDYRSKGFDDTPKRGLRIDQIWATKSLNDCLESAGIDYKTRGMEKPSDHAPVWSNFIL